MCMKKIINGKKYDTETAKKVGFACNNVGRGDFSWWEEELYQKKTGEFFLYGTGGPASKYNQSCGLNEWTGGEHIYPMTIDEAKKWAEKNLDADEYEEIFGEVKE